MNEIKAILLPGNGGGSPNDAWFPYLETELPKLGIKVINKQFPDPVLAREQYWLPFVKELGADINTILIGHSSGAVAAMRFAENNKILGSVLVGACYTDLDNDMEKKSGYYNRPWNWQAIKSNQKWIMEFASTDDPFIPIEEARHIHEMLNAEYFEFTNQGHFAGPEFPELLAALKLKI